MGAARGKRTASPRSLANSGGFRAFVLDQLSDLGDVSARSMFGGAGLYYGDLFFGIVARNTLYLKVDESNRADYESEGMTPFRPYPDRAGTMRYYQVPAAVLESAPELVRWTRKAVAAARRTARQARSGSGPERR